MTTIILIGLGACALSVLSATVYALGSATGYRRGIVDGRRADPQRLSLHTLMLHDALSAARRN